MIICSCNRLSEAEIARHCTEEMQSCEQVYARMGCQINCGGCADYVESVLLKPEMPIEIAFEGQAVRP